MNITLEAVMATRPCYSREYVAELLALPGTPLDTLLSIPRPDARYVLARLLTVSNRVVWARACAERAKGYAYAAADAADAATAAYAAYAADAYAADAAAYAADAAEHRLAYEHALALIAGQP